MLFNSIEFLLFLPAVFLLYWFVFNRSLWWQNIFVVAVSYVFYGWWDWKFLLLIALTSFCSWLSGIWMGERDREICPVTGLRGYRRLVMVANVAEAYRKRRYLKHYVMKLTDADSEASETVVWLNFAKDCGYITQDCFDPLSSSYGEIGSLLGFMIDHPEKFGVPRPI